MRPTWLGRRRPRSRPRCPHRQGLPGGCFLLCLLYRRFCSRGRLSDRPHCSWPSKDHLVQSPRCTHTGFGMNPGPRIDYLVSRRVFRQRLQIERGNGEEDGLRWRVPPPARSLWHDDAWSRSCLGRPMACLSYESSTRHRSKRPAPPRRVPGPHSWASARRGSQRQQIRSHPQAPEAPGLLPVRLVPGIP